MSIDLEAQVQAIADAMMERDKEVSAEYSAAYYIANRDYILDVVKENYKWNKDSIAERKKSYYIRERSLVSSNSHKDYIKNRPERLRKAKQYREANAEQVAATKAKWRMKNHDKLIAQGRAYHAANKVLKGRSIGSKHANSRLTEALVLDMRNQYRDGASLRKLAVIFNVAKTTVANVIHRRSWKHVI